MVIACLPDVPRIMIPDDEMTSEWYDRFIPDSLWRNAMAAWIETTDIAIFRVVQGVVLPGRSRRGG
jgi:hypothetical protein